MRKNRINKAKINLKEKAFTEFNKGKYTQRELANKYKICETELSRYFSIKLNRQSSNKILQEK